jgi:hypothetical protein
MYYRQNLRLQQKNQVSLNNYAKQNFKRYINTYEMENTQISETNNKIEGYNFDDTLDYYEKREENFIVGIIDMNTNKLASADIDLFKIRQPRAKVLDKKRGTGIPTFKGAVCSTTKDKGYLIDISKKLDSNNTSVPMKGMTKESICLRIRDQLLHLEKYATTSDKNKVTYIMIPSNHPNYPFPYNLEDRIKYKLEQLYKIIGYKIDHQVIKKKGTYVSYDIIFKNEKELSSFSKEFEKLGFKLGNNNWLLLIE